MFKFFKQTLIWMLILSLVFPSFAIAKSKSKRGVLERVHRESITLANMKISAVDGTAFIDFSNSETAKLIDHLGYLVKIRDSAGRALQGFVGSAGSGETFDSTLVTNGTFDANINGWNNSTFSTFVWDASGKLSLTDTGVGEGWSNDDISLTLGKLYKSSVDLTMTSGRMRVQLRDAGGANLRSTITSVVGETASGTYSSYYTSSYTENVVFMFQCPIASVVLADNCSVKQVTAPSASGVTIVSTKGGAVQSFAKKDTAFNYNDASGYTMELWKVNSAVQVSTGSVPAGEGKMDTTTANAFAAPESATVPFDLSAYQDGRHLYWAQDSAGKVACAWISSSAPGGESLEATERVTNGDFSSAVGWTLGAGWTISANEAHGDGSGNGTDLYRTTSLTVGAVYKSSVDVTAATSGTIRFAGELGSGTTLGVIGTLSVYKTYFTDNNIYIKSNLFNGSIDNASRKRLDDCAATGALLLSTQGGSRGYLLKDAAFNPNLALTYKILYVGSD